jgi:adenylosuccinate synthase
MNSVVVVGAQWGDEGKGKVVDYLAEQADTVVRYAGGNNAGHTIVVKGEKTILHLIPSGVLHRGKVGVLGNGMVVDPSVLLQEMGRLAKRGIRLTPKNFFISERAHLIMPYHRRIDLAREGAKTRKGRIGTTGRGIGPAYEDKANRAGIRFVDLLNRELFEERLRAVLREKNAYLKSVLKQPGFSFSALREEYLGYARILKRHVTDVSRLLDGMLLKGKRILFEGAQGTLLDIDHGTYPFVTSSNAGVGGVLAGCGVAPYFLQEILGVIKAYTTRVGGGPFPTELNDEVGEHLRREGEEYGATTGRARRCGWFDAVAGRYGARVNGFTGLALTKLDTLTGVDPIRICTAYRVGRSRITEFPSDIRLLEQARPVYEEMPGWREDIRGARSLADLPRNTVRYVRRLEEIVGVPFFLVSVGPQRQQSIVLENPFEAL